MRVLRRFSETEKEAIRAFYTQANASGCSRELNIAALARSLNRNVGCIYQHARRAGLSDEVDLRFGNTSQRLETLYTVSKTGDHWLFAGDQQSVHTFRLRRDGKSQDVRRYLYRKEIGDIPDGNYLVRTCRSATCVNPHHAKVSTSAEIVRRSQSSLTPAKIERILALKIAGWTLRKIAGKFGIHYSAVSLIVNGKRWAK